MLEKIVFKKNKIEINNIKVDNIQIKNQDQI